MASYQRPVLRTLILLHLFIYLFYGSLVLIDDGFLSPFHSNSHNKDTLGRCV